MRYQTLCTPAGRLILALCALALMCACTSGTDEIRIRGGTLELNDRLRADMGPSAGMTDGHFFADGTCASGAANVDECHFITSVHGSLIGAGSGFYLSRLRRSDFLWVAGGNGFPVLSWEFVGTGITIYEVDDPSDPFANNVTVGTCNGFPGLDPQTRHVIPEFEDMVVTPQARLYVQQFDVNIRECAGPMMPVGVSETLQPVTDNTGNCSNTSVAAALGPNYAPYPQNPPFCVVNFSPGTMMGDVSYAATPGALPGIDIDELWPGLDVSARTLLPHLKAVPVDGSRTISRPLVRTGQRRTNYGDDEDGDGEPDETITHWFTFRVDFANDKWNENFSPNIFVTHARVRNGAWVAGGSNYLPIERLKVNVHTCQTRVPGSNDTEYDILMCEPETGRPFRVTPAYLHSSIDMGPVNDVDRIEWEVLIRIPPALADDADQLFLELDLSATDSTGTGGAILIPDPLSRDLGSMRTGPSSSRDGFTVRNYGVGSVWIDSVQLVGGNAVEFAAPILYRGALGAASTGTPISAPLILQGGSTFSVVFQPAFQSAGQKISELVVTNRNLDGSSTDMRIQLSANATSPAINLDPPYVIFNAVPGAGLFGSASAIRMASLTNYGTAPFDRLGVSVSGPQASSFRVLGTESGSTNLSVAQPFTVVPTQSETYRIGFYPSLLGHSQATFTVHTSEGDVSIQLDGRCQQDCEQTPGIAINPPRELAPEEMSRKIVFPEIKIRTRLSGKKTDG